MSRRLLPKIRSFSAALYSRLARKLSGSSPKITRPVSIGTRERAIDALRNGRGRRRCDPELIVAGVSTGGPEALSRLLPALPGDFDVPMVIVQHMPERFLRSLAGALDRRAPILVKVAEHREPLRPGVVYLAPGGQHVKVRRDRPGQLTCRLTDDPPENGFRPSADVLFRSAAECCGGNTLALLLTGMGGDGARGLEDLKKAGALALAQDEESSVVWGMPGRAVRSDLVDEILPLNRIAGRLVEWVNQ